jgi:hypothetical protein
MRVKVVAIMALVLAIAIGMSTNVFAQEKAQKGKKSADSGKMSSVQGTVGKVDKDTITVLVRNAPKPVTINSDTKFMMGHSNDNKPGSVSEVKSGNYIACSGSLNDKQQFVAKQCVYRDKQ